MQHQKIATTTGRQKSLRGKAVHGSGAATLSISAVGQASFGLVSNTATDVAGSAPAHL